MLRNPSSNTYELHNPTRSQSNLLAKVTVYSPIARNNLPFQLNLHSSPLLNINKIPSNPPRIWIPQNFILFLFPFLRNTHSNTRFGAIRIRSKSRRSVFFFSDIDYLFFGWGSHVDNDTFIFGDGDLIHDCEFLERTGFQVSDSDELRVALDGGFIEDHATF
jgi:hypothetical protein